MQNYEDVRNFAIQLESSGISTPKKRILLREYLLQLLYFPMSKNEELFLYNAFFAIDRPFPKVSPKQESILQYIHSLSVLGVDLKKNVLPDLEGVPMNIILDYRNEKHISKK